MNLHARRSGSPRTHAAAFSLIEVTLSLALIGTALVGVLGVLPAGLDASKRAVDSTIVANVLDVLHHRLQGEPLTGTVPLGLFAKPVLFDAQGVVVAPERSAAERAPAVYRADLTLTDWRERPVHTSGLRVVTIALTWPVDPRTGEIPRGLQPRLVTSFPVTALTGTDWPAIAREYKSDPVFVPRSSSDY